MRHLGQRAGLERMQSVLTGMVNTSIRAQLKAWHMAALRARMENMKRRKMFSRILCRRAGLGPPHRLM